MGRVIPPGPPPPPPPPAITLVVVTGDSTLKSGFISTPFTAMSLIGTVPVADTYTWTLITNLGSMELVNNNQILGTVPGIVTIVATSILNPAVSGSKVITIIPQASGSSGGGIPGPQGQSGLQGIPGAAGLQGVPGPQGVAGPAGINAGQALVWLGTFDAPPTSPLVDQAYRNAALGQSLVWTGSAWQIMNVDGAVGPAGVQGVQGIQGIQGIQGPQGKLGPNNPAGAFVPGLAQLLGLSPVINPTKVLSMTVLPYIGADITNIAGTDNISSSSLIVNNTRSQVVSTIPIGFNGTGCRDVGLNWFVWGPINMCLVNKATGAVTNIPLPSTVVNIYDYACWDGGSHVYLVGATSPGWCIIAADLTALVSSVLTALPNPPVGICCDGINLWTGYTAGGGLCQTVIATGVTSVIIVAGLTQTKGLCFDGTTVWLVSNQVSGNIHGIRVDTLAISSFTLSVPSSGLPCFDGKNVYIPTTGTTLIIWSPTRLLSYVVTVSTADAVTCTFDGVFIWLCGFSNAQERVLPI